MSGEKTTETRHDVAGFHVDQGALFPCIRLVTALMRTANPVAGRVSAVLIVQPALQNEDFLTAEMAMLLEPGMGRPSHQRNVLCSARAGEFMQWHHLQTIDQTRQPFTRAGIDNLLLGVALIELVQLYEYERTFPPHPGAVAGPDWITYIASCRIAAVLIGKLTFQLQDLFSAAVTMLGKFTVGVVADQRCCSGYLVTQAVKHHAGNARNR